MKSIPGVLNHWTSPQELEKLRKEAKALAYKWFGGDPEYELWQNRTINLAQGISSHYWDLITHMSSDQVISLVAHMISQGFPADRPYEETVMIVRESSL